MYLNHSNEKHRIKIDKLLNHNAEFRDLEASSALSNTELSQTQGTNITLNPPSHSSFKTEGCTNRESISIANLVVTDSPKDTVNNQQLPTLLQHTDRSISPLESRTHTAVHGTISTPSTSTFSVYNSCDYTIAPTVNTATSVPSYTYSQATHPSIKSNTDLVYSIPFADTPKIDTAHITEPQYYHAYNRPTLSKKRRRGNLPKEVTDLLKRWLIMHRSYPYPTEREKQQLADETGLMVSQISNWFINARRRILQPLLESERDMHTSTISTTTTSSVLDQRRSSENTTTISSVIEKPSYSIDRRFLHARVPSSSSNQLSPIRTSLNQPVNPVRSSLTMPIENDPPKSRVLTQGVPAPRPNGSRSILYEHPMHTDQIAPILTQKPSDFTVIPTATSPSSVKLPPMKILDKDLDAFRF